MKTFKRATNSNSLIDLNEPVVVDICMTCDLFQTLATTFTQLRMDIVAGKNNYDKITKKNHMNCPISNAFNPVVSVM